MFMQTNSRIPDPLRYITQRVNRVMFIFALMTFAYCATGFYLYALQHSMYRSLMSDIQETAEVMQKHGDEQYCNSLLYGELSRDPSIKKREREFEPSIRYCNILLEHRSSSFNPMIPINIMLNIVVIFGITLESMSYTADDWDDCAERLEILGHNDPNKICGRAGFRLLFWGLTLEAAVFLAEQTHAVDAMSLAFAYPEVFDSALPYVASSIYLGIIAAMWRSVITKICAKLPVPAQPACAFSRS